MSADAEAETAAPSLATMTAFKRDVLWVLKNEGKLKGIRVLRILEEYYGRPVNHGQLYPNLDELVDDGLVEKEAIDGRTNAYSLTEAGAEALAEREAWERGEGQ